ncbi:DUF1993 domain-containing protein [Leptospira langatensis]|uniref:DUF1993 domain-containing protein n=1 Tax=Leptospira langatensis TaxID=2484983 RepID=A0A5F1ZN95_9LEPT|nr:DUF1993 domain-containing protein [Leptospira langatensis]TGK05173.1 DUF1993 domain-containing protein [Leptospira langatensis]TGL38309.1 DUF1993 domain-containing protein [Leptospira langatensis]
MQHISMYELTNTQFIKVLGNLTRFIEKGEAYAGSKKFDVEVLLNSRLAPDQFHFIRQVQSSCDTAKLGASRLTGKQAPVHEDTEKTLSEIKFRIEDVIRFLRTFTEADYNEAASNKISLPRWEGKFLSGAEYAIHHMIPNFYFHITTAYDILRHNGVDVGKRDYLGELPLRN